MFDVGFSLFRLLLRTRRNQQSQRRSSSSTIPQHAPLIVGMSAPQGFGKTTIAEALHVCQTVKVRGPSEQGISLLMFAESMKPLIINMSWVLNELSTYLID